MQTWWEFGRDWKFESKLRACVCISIWRSTRTTCVRAPTYIWLGDICVMQLLRKSDSAPDSSSWETVSFFLFFLQTRTLKKEEEKSQCLDPSRQTKNSDSLAFCSSPPAPKYCPLLFFFSSSAPSLPIIYSILSDGPAKTLPEDKVSPLHPPHAHVSLPNEISN